MIIDIALLIFALAGFWWGYTRGVLSTLILVPAYFIALLVTLKISPWLMDFVTGSFNIGKMFALIFGTIAILVTLIFLIHWLFRRGETSFKKGKLSGSSKILGGIVMLLVGMLFYSMVLWPLNQFGMIGQKSKETSITYKTIEAVPVKADVMIKKFQPVFKRYWELMEQIIQENKEKTSE
jgi:uncharacterized membrane protein required for colicin V production